MECTCTRILAETQDEEAFCLAKFGYRPVRLYAVCGLDRPGCVVCPFSPCQPLRNRGLRPNWLRGGALPNFQYAPGFRDCTLARVFNDLGSKVGLGVDGSASNDSSHLLAEGFARRCCLPGCGKAWEGASLSSNADFNGNGSNKLLTCQEALELATRGGADVLGRKDIGALRLAAVQTSSRIDLNRLDYVRRSG